MFKRSKLNTRIYAPTHRWRNYQVKLHKQSAKEKALRRLPAYLITLAILVALTKGLFLIFDWTITRPSSVEASLTPETVQPLEQTLLPHVLSNQPWATISQKTFDLKAGIREYRMSTNIMPALQQVIIDNIDQKYAKYFGFVAMDPSTGKILAMVSFDKTGENSNVCTRPDFPAASLIKIVTAAAAIEKCGFTCTTPVAYNGKKYSLYKSQLKHRENKYTNHITFEDSFADSINPVFGKIGINQLKKAGLEKYATAFGFNRAIPFDIALPESPLHILDEPYNWAEIACGFNRQTLISPLHAAVLVAGVINEGKLMVPTLIDTAHENDELVYQSRSRTLNQAISPHTAQILKKLMHATITEGTARSAFHARRRDDTLSNLNIGGKTGSINNNPLHIKYDWFAGFAEEINGPKKLAVAAFVAHKDYIGTRAAAYAKMAFQEYFRKPAADSNV